MPIIPSPTVRASLGPGYNEYSLLVGIFFCILLHVTIGTQCRKKSASTILFLAPLKFVIFYSFSINDLAPILSTDNIF